MELDQYLAPGASREETFTVDASHTADKVDSGSLPVLATPQMIAFMEGVSHRLVGEKLPDTHSSVGILVNIQHLAPTPPGAQVKVKATVQEIVKSKVVLEIEAHDGTDEIGRGKHDRVVIDTNRFMERVKAKLI